MEIKPFVITPEMIYGRTVRAEDAPEGFEFTGEFRSQRIGEFFLSNGYFRAAYAESNGRPSRPLLILRKKPAMRTVTIEVEEGKSLMGFIVEAGTERTQEVIDRAVVYRELFGVKIGKPFVK